MAFYPSDWVAGTARMTRLHRSVYFDLCCYIWDYALAVPAAELPIMFGDLPDWQRYIEELVAARKLRRTEDGSIVNDRALDEAVKARDLHRKKSEGGRTGANKTNERRGYAAGSADGSPIGTAGESATGVATQNQNQNQNQTSPNGEDTRKRAKLAGKPDAVEQSTWDDFQALRTKKRAPLTETALKGIEREAGKAGYSLNRALAECCERGWQGFKAEWVMNGGNRNGHANSKPSGWLA